MPTPSASVLTVEPLAGRESEWAEYVAGHPEATPYHDLAIRAVIEEAFGHRSHYRVAVADGRVCGVLPLTEMRSVLFGNYLVSVPFFNYGGVLADDDETARALAESAAELAAGMRVRHVEIRQGAHLPLDWGYREHKVAMIVSLAEGAEAYWKGLSSRLRGKVRRAERDGAEFTVVPHGDVPRRLAEFYEVFCKNMRDLGTPVYTRALFERFFEHMGERATLFLVHVGGTPVAGSIGIRNSRGMELPWICSNYDFSRNRVNEFLYWKTLEWCAGNGVERVDLGRSSVDSGPFRFKLHWNPEQCPLRWYYWTPEGARPADLNPENPKFNLGVKAWKKLPLPVANAIGPHLVRSIP